MRQKRAKAYRKLMAVYSMTFGFHQPYQTLVDSLTCKEAVEHKLDLVKQFEIVLQGTVKPMITQCCIHELYLQGKAAQPIVDLAKTFERRKCNHKEAIPGDECIATVVGDTNKHRYVVATQSPPLRTKLRTIPGVPVVHINRSVMILEPMSDTSSRVKAASEQQIMLPSASEVAQLPSQTAEAGPSKKKRKGPKGPNPLSVKKKKPAEPAATKPKPVDSKNVTSSAKRKRESEPDETIKHNEGSGHKRRRRRKEASKSDAADSAPAD